MSRKNEIAQGLRHEDGGLVGGLVVEDCVAAQKDYEGGRPPPRMTSASYDIWRARLTRLADEEREFRGRLRADELASRERVRAILIELGRLDMLADFDAKMMEIDERSRPLFAGRRALGRLAHHRPGALPVGPAEVVVASEHDGVDAAIRAGLGALPMAAELVAPLALGHGASSSPLEAGDGPSERAMAARAYARAAFQPMRAASVRASMNR